MRKIRFRISAQARSRSTDAAIFALGAGRGSRRRKGWRRSTVSPRRLPEEEVREALGLSENSKVLEFTQLIRSAEGAPVGIDVKYMPYRRSYPSVESEMRFAVFPDITMPHVTPYAYYTEFTISAAAASGKQAEILQCVEKTPLLLIRRLMIERGGKRIAYALRYLLPEYGCLFGSSGYVNEDGGFPKNEAKP